MPLEAKLTVVGGKANKPSITIRLPAVVGRSPDAGLTIAHITVSRKHCELYDADGLVMIRDLGSLNGTFVAGQRIKESPLPPNTEFAVGPLTFRVQYAYAGDLADLPNTVFFEDTMAFPAMEPLAASPAIEEMIEPAAEESPEATPDFPIEEPTPAQEAESEEFFLEETPSFGLPDVIEEPAEKPIEEPVETLVDEVSLEAPIEPTEQAITEEEPSLEVVEEPVADDLSLIDAEPEAAAPLEFDLELPEEPVEEMAVEVAETEPQFDLEEISESAAEEEVEEVSEAEITAETVPATPGTKEAEDIFAFLDRPNTGAPPVREESAPEAAPGPVVDSEPPPEAEEEFTLEEIDEDVSVATLEPIEEIEPALEETVPDVAVSEDEAIEFSDFEEAVGDPESELELAGDVEDALELELEDELMDGTGTAENVVPEFNLDAELGIEPAEPLATVGEIEDMQAASVEAPSEESAAADETQDAEDEEDAEAIASVAAIGKLSVAKKKKLQRSWWDSFLGLFGKERAVYTGEDDVIIQVPEMAENEEPQAEGLLEEELAAEESVESSGEEFDWDTLQTAEGVAENAPEELAALEEEFLTAELDQEEVVAEEIAAAEDGGEDFDWDSLPAVDSEDIATTEEEFSLVEDAAESADIELAFEELPQDQTIDPSYKAKNAAKKPGNDPFEDLLNGLE